jgi:hypothetical protein
MSSLTSTQINNTYPGLLKLEDSTSGLTNSFQTIQDGLGNNLPLKVKDGQIQGQNLFSLGYFVFDYEGAGFSTGAATTVAGAQNNLSYTAFYNSGINSFSAITYRVNTATSNGDVVSLAFYTAQFISGLGLQPKDLVMSGISLNSTSTGTTTTALPATLSFSGLGSGIYFAVQKITPVATGNTPTVRYNSPPTGNQSFLMAQQQGFVLNSAQTALQNISLPGGAGTASSGNAVYSNTPDFKLSFDASDFVSGVNTATYAGFGFGLNVIK